MPNYPPGYEPQPPRTPEEIEAEINRRCGYVQGVVRILDKSEVKSLPAPEENLKKLGMLPTPPPAKHGKGGRFAKSGKNNTGNE